MSEVDFEKVKPVIEKLLEKAGKDPRVTPKLLRMKAESKLQLSSGQLKSFRNQIKDVIWKWWEDDQSYTLQQLVHLSRALSLAPAILKDIKAIPSVTGRVEELSKRLKNANVTFTACPTDQEIEDARRETERKKSLDEIDPSLILESKRKRGAETEESAKRPKDSSQGSSTSKSRVVVSDDEEAEF